MNPRRHARNLRPRLRRGFSLIELMVVVAVAVLIISLAAPSFSEYIVTQRVRSVHAQLVTDIQYARSEAASRGQIVAIQFEHKPGASGHSCYTIYVRDVSDNPRNCTCLNTDGSVIPEGSRCTAAFTSEIRSVIIENRLGVTVDAEAVASLVTSPRRPVVNFDPQSGRYIVPAASLYPASMSDGLTITTRADASRSLNAVVNLTGRTMVCTPADSSLGGLPCPTP